MKIAAVTDTGRVRNSNEDSFWIDTKLQAMAVADGMGGHNGGEVASLLATQSFAMLCDSMLSYKHLDNVLPATMPMVIPAIDKLVTMTGNKTVYLTGMGTTIVGAIYFANQLHITHVGDSRAAFISLSDGRLTWLTKDDNYAEHLVAHGWMTEEEARRSNHRHQLTACIGGYGEYVHIANVHYQQVAWTSDELLLLCSDGLLDGVKDEEIVKCCIDSANQGLSQVCRRLVNLANSKGGRDNCTAIMASIA